MVLANFNNGNLSGGTPFTSEPDSLTGYFRYSIPNGDTASIAMFFTADGFPVNIISIPITGEQLSFSYHAFDLPPFFATPDTVLVFISSSGANTPINSGWLEIDDLIFTNSNDQLPNNGFEDWVDIDTENPDDWTSTNFISELTDSPLAVTKSNDAHTGNFAMRLETVEISFFGDEPDTVGYVSTGSVGDDGIEGGFPYSGQPDKLTGYYKYTPVGNDTAVINVYFTKYNSTTGETDELFDELILLPPTSSYTKFELPIELSEIPDTANVTIGSSNYAEEENFKGVGSVLWIDDVQFELINGTKLPLFAEEISIYPNPADDYTTLDLGAGKGDVQSVIFFDALGRRVLHLKTPNQFENTLNIKTYQLKNGIYWYLVKTDTGDFSGKLKVER